MPDLDAALRRTARGKLTLVWGPDGDLVFDDTGAYPVLTTVHTHKGRYFFDTSGEQGTFLHLVKQDKFSTGDQLRAYGQDALDQCKAAGIIESGSTTARRERPGSWLLGLSWMRNGKRHTPPGGDLKV